MNLRQIGKIALANLLPQSVYLFVNAHAAAREIASKYRWEPEIESLRYFVTQGDVVIDVGGNHGLYAYHLSHLVGLSGRVHTFEPLPPNLSILAHTIKKHKLSNVLVHPQGCGMRAETVTFGVALDHGVPLLWLARQGEGGLRFQCDVIRLDDVIAEKVSFLKMDVEGAELFVLRGAERILRESRPVILFEALSLTGHYGYGQQEVFGFLSELEYRFLSGGDPAKALQSIEGFMGDGNYFAVPKERIGNF